MKKNFFIITSFLAIALLSGCATKTIRQIDSVIMETSEPVIEFIVDETEAVESTTEPPVLIVDEVPKYNQLNYTCPYGEVEMPNGQMATVRTHGCGITCLSMVATYLLDDPSLTPDVLAEKFGSYNTKSGSPWTLFRDSADVLGLGEVTEVYDWNIGGVEEALKNGCLVISNQRDGLFTKSGHYILLTGITEEGKVIVHDPNGANWTKYDMIESFETGFEYTDISYTSAAYWIYEPKVFIE